MKLLIKTLLAVMAVPLSLHANPTTGFSLPDSLTEYTIEYKSVDNLIVLPVVINDSITVNLILDTGCRNIVLFGKRFQKTLTITPTQNPILFSGIGSGKGVQGLLSLHNQVSIGKITGEVVPVVVVPKRNIFQEYPSIDGLIGYDIFTRFEVEINPARHQITFRPAMTTYVPYGYTKIPITVIDAQPMLQSTIELDNESLHWSLLIDTGSSLGLLLKSTDKKMLNTSSSDHGYLGTGLNGAIAGKKTVADRLVLDDFEITNIPTGIIHNPWRNQASIGMHTLKDYSVILNYVQSYMCLKRV